MKQKLITTETSENTPCDFYKSNTLQSQIDIQPLATAIYKELEDMYDIDFDQIYKDYYYNKNRINRNDCYIMDAIEYTPQLRDALKLLINTTLVQDNLIWLKNKIKKTKKQYSVRTQTKNRNTKEMKDMCMKHTTRSGNTLIRCSHVNNSKWDKAYLLILKPEDCKAEYINYCPNCGGKLKEY